MSGVLFSVSSHDHWPPHVHAEFAGIDVVVEMMQGEARVATRKRPMRPTNAKRSDGNKILQAAANNADISLAIWEQVHGLSGLSARPTKRSMQSLPQKNSCHRSLTLVDAEYLRNRDLFLLKISDGRRLAIPREDIWAVRNATPDPSADFVIGTHRVSIWWPQVDEGLYLPEALEGRYGSKAGMDHVHRRTTVAA